MNIEQNIIDEIVDKSDIVEIIGKYLKLKRSGNNYFACCPFHNEKSPSFAINANKQFFHCFGCGESGNVITFLMKYNGQEFTEVVLSLAAQAGIEIKQDKKFSKEITQQQKQHKTTLFEVIAKVHNFYQNNLVNASFAKNYLTTRGLSSEIIKKFAIGYANNTSNLLSGLFKDYLTNELLVEAGLVIVKEDGTRFDRFRDRIMFPIKNVKGQIIAFGGRVIVNGEPKYLNSPETNLFNKSQELYGLYEAQKVIRDKNQAIVVEGYMDVIAMAQYEIDFTVASMGTAITEEQIKKLFKHCDNLYYCFDGDIPGQKAAWRALERSLMLVTDIKSVHFIFLPEEHDPDSFLRKFGRNAFLQYKETKSLSLTKFLLKQLCAEIDITSNEGKAKLISIAKPYIEKIINAPALKVMLKKDIAELVELVPSALESIFNNRSRYAFYNLNNNQLVKSKKQIPKFNIIELIILNALKNIAWVVNYRLPENIDNLSPEVQEMIIILDFITTSDSPA
ncbi:MAG: hypothetical protein RL017_884, partial [Pseudomonadota bacterium]